MNLLILVITIDPSECSLIHSLAHTVQYRSKFIRRLHLILIYCEKCEQKCDILPIGKCQTVFSFISLCPCTMCTRCGARVCYVSVVFLSISRLENTYNTRVRHPASILLSIAERHQNQAKRLKWSVCCSKNKSDSIICWIIPWFVHFGEISTFE